MALAAKLQMRQSQSLVMTPQLMQSIRLLQFSHQELERFVEEEIERNPLLERVDPQEDAATDIAQEANGLEAQEWRDSDAGWSSDAIADTLDTSLENVFPDDPGRSTPIGPDLAAQWKSASLGSGSGDGSGFDLEAVTPAQTTLADHVGEQIAFAFLDPVDRAIAHYLADELDEAGYFRSNPGEIAERLGTTASEVERVLATCRGFDPAGLFADDLATCLRLQLARKDRLDPAMDTLTRHLDLLARRDFQALGRLCGVDEEDLIDMLAEIRSLDPRPGLAFGGGHTETIVADVEVRPASDGSWIVELNQDTLPRVLVDQIYYTEVSQQTRSASEREFLSGCLQSANWLTRSLDQRARTILKVASEIVRQQDAFLLHGIRHLRPLNLRTVAEAIGMHESTVSRVTSNKYMLTPRGVFELRFFFTAAIPAAGHGEAHSSEAVRDRIRQMIEDESPDAVLSDDAIVEALQKNGIDIARRTVAKYREGMNIPSSVQRRREKRALALAGR
jgi:RNA polymerase sigma-54 factor